MSLWKTTGERVADFAVGVVLIVGLLFAGTVATFMVGMIGRSDCTGRCRTYVDAGSALMFYATLIVELAVLVLMVWSWRRRWVASVWPLLSIPALAAVGVVSFMIAWLGPGA